MAVIAGPGTGKTKTLTARIQYLLETRKVKPSEITAVTFTNLAAKELKEKTGTCRGEEGEACRGSRWERSMGSVWNCLRKRQTGADRPGRGRREIAGEILREYGLDLPAKSFCGSFPLENRRRRRRISKGDREQHGFL